MTSTRQAMLQNLHRGRPGAGDPAATRDAQAISEGDLNPSASPAGIARPPEVERPTPDERIGALLMATDDVRQDRGANVGSWISEALKQRGVGSSEGLVGGEGLDAAPGTEGQQAMADARRWTRRRWRRWPGRGRDRRAGASRGPSSSGWRRDQIGDMVDQHGALSAAGERRIADGAGGESLRRHGAWSRRSTTPPRGP